MTSDAANAAPRSSLTTPSYLSFIARAGLCALGGARRVGRLDYVPQPLRERARRVRVDGRGVPGAVFAELVGLLEGLRVALSLRGEGRQADALGRDALLRARVAREVEPPHEETRL